MAANICIHFIVFLSDLSLIARDVAERITSIYAELIALCAASTAVSSPKVLSISNMSLSIVLGTQTIDTCNFLLRHCNKNFAKIQCQMDSQPSTFAIFIQNYKSMLHESNSGINLLQ